MPQNPEEIPRQYQSLFSLHPRTANHLGRSIVSGCLAATTAALVAINTAMLYDPSHAEVVFQADVALTSLVVVEGMILEGLARQAQVRSGNAS